MKTTHTPGPWHNAHDERSDYAEIRNANEGIICRCSNDNARLIAAAPELLAALERCLRDGDLPLGVDSQARAAIASARGEK